MWGSRSKRRVSIFVAEADVAAVTGALLGLASLTFVAEEEQPPSDWTPPTEDTWSELADTYEDLEERAARLLEMLQLSPEPAPVPVSAAPRQDAYDMVETLRAAERAVTAWNDQSDTLETQREHIELLMEEVRPLVPLDVPVERLRDTQFLYVRVGTVPREHLADLYLALSHHLFVILPVHTFEDRVLVFAASAKDDAAILDQTLESAAVECLDLPEELHGPAKAVLEQLADRRDAMEAQRAELSRGRRRLVTEWGDRLLRLWHQAARNRAITRQITQFSQHEDFYLIVGEVAEDAVAEVEAAVQRVAEAPYAVTTAPASEPQAHLPARVIGRLRRSVRRLGSWVNPGIG